ncbi:MAG: hypothetical protein IJ729_05350 [Alloprevotella sp.]|nr:hypothetical protein [Alloprevotella sp.]
MVSEVTFRGFRRALSCRLLLLAALLVGMPGSSQRAYGANPIKDKALQKECQRFTKQLTQEGWTVWGSTASLKAAANAYFQQLEQAAGEASPLEARAEEASANAAVRRAMNNAVVQYALLQESHIEGTTQTRIVTEGGGEDATSSNTFDASYRSSTAQRVKALKPALSLVRKLPNGRCEALLLYIIPN